MSEAELPITGYLDRLSHRPGEAFAAHISVQSGGSYTARLVRVLSADPNPEGPGLRFEDLSRIFEQRIAGRRREIRQGSYGHVSRGPAMRTRERTWTALVLPTFDAPMQAVLSEEKADTSARIAVGAGGVSVRLAWPGGAAVLTTGQPIGRGQWYRVWLAADAATGRIRAGQQALAGGPALTVGAAAPGLRLPAQGTVLIGATRAESPELTFTGKIEAPAILGEFCNEITDSLTGPNGRLLACWDFSLGIASQDILDIGPEACHGRLINRPTRGVVGARWSGREMCWRHAPADYAAIHFHGDDLDDCGWPADFSWTVPDDLPSGAYAFHLAVEGVEDWLPFYVLPRRAGPIAPIAFLAPTFTYQAYANHARGNADAAYRARVKAWGAYPHNPDDYPLYGRSTYNRHADDSGIAFSSRLRPWLTMRPGFLTFNDARGSGLRHYPADSHILAWLADKGFAFDVLTDDDLDEEGAALLAPYRAVLTGTHPEYHTLRTLDALEEYAHRGGGRLAYLGGNGFYWRIAREQAVPHVIEVRRAEGGIRAWAAEPGEYYHATDGQYGGLWRRNRRPPQRLAGVGFSCQGLFEGTHYRRLAASHEKGCAWIFAGIDEEILGDYGLSGGGAAGFELDRADYTLGTPEDALILARSDAPPASFVTVPEELLSHLHTVSGEPVQVLRRAEIVYFETARGGAVFSAGSITFCGSLWRKGFEGPISRLLENVLRGWLKGERPGR